MALKLKKFYHTERLFTKYDAMHESLTSKTMPFQNKMRSIINLKTIICALLIQYN